MKSLYSAILILAMSLIAAACSLTANKMVDEKEMLVADETITVSGHSQIDRVITASQQQRFAAEQSAKLNGYRQLAAILYQKRLADGRVVGGQVMKNEAYRLYFDIFLRNAKVVNWQVLGNTLYTSMALTVTDRFYQCIASDSGFLAQCLQEENKLPFTRLGYNSAQVKTINLACGSIDCNGLLDVGGFSHGKNAFDRGLLNVGLYDAEWLLNTSSRLFANYFLIKGISK